MWQGQTFEVRPATDLPPDNNGNPHVDEIVADGWRCHIEQLSDTEYMVLFNKGAIEDDTYVERRFFIGSKSGRAAIAMYEQT